MEQFTGIDTATMSRAEFHTARTMNLSWCTWEARNNQQVQLFLQPSITHRDNAIIPTTICQDTSLPCLVQSGMECYGPVFHFETWKEQGWAGDGRLAALNELLGAFSSAQAWISPTWHPGSLLRYIPFKTIIYQQWPAQSFYIYSIYSKLAVSLCP